MEPRRGAHAMILLILWSFLVMLLCKLLHLVDFMWMHKISLHLFIVLWLFVHRDKLCIWVASDHSSQRLQRGGGGEAQQDTETQQGAEHNCMFLFCYNKIMQVSLCWTCNQNASLPLSAALILIITVSPQLTVGLYEFEVTVEGEGAYGEGYVNVTVKPGGWEPLKSCLFYKIMLELM